MVDNKYITFGVDTDQRCNGHEVYVIVNKRSQTPLGNIFWYPTWRQWVARMNDDAVWSHDCLDSVREFVLALNARGKE